MSASVNFAAMHGPPDLAAAAGVELPSVAVECALDAMYATTPTLAQRKLWKTISRMPWPTRRMRRVVACIGRRGLKTSGLLAWSCVFEMLCCVSHELHAAENSRVYFLVIAPYVAQAREAVRAIRAVLDALAHLGVRYALRDASGSPEIVLLSPASRVEKVVRVVTADSVAVRSVAAAWVAFDEAGFLDSEETHAQTDRDLLRAVLPAMVTFPESRVLMVSSPGAPQGIFWEWVTKPTRDTLVMRSPSWVMNARVTREMCRDLAGDAATFAQEFEAARFGYANESFIDSSTLRLGSKYAALGPRPGAFVVGADFGQIHDSSAVVVCSSFAVDTSPGHAPIRHVVCERVEIIPSSRTAPTPIEAIAGRVAALSKLYGGAPVLHDAFAGPSVKSALRAHGFREDADATGASVPKRRTFRQVSMSPQIQTPRWRLVRDLAHGRRLHLGTGAGDRELARQLANLHVSTLPSGAWRVDGREDDACDALALAAEVAVRLPPTGGDGSAAEWESHGVTWDREQGLSAPGRWVKRHPNGLVELAEMPRWAPGYGEWAAGMIERGLRTPGIVEWEREREEQTRAQAAFEVPMTDHD